MFFLPGPARGIGDIGSCLGRKMTGGHCTNVFLLLLVRRSPPCDHHALLCMNEWCIHIVLYFVLLYTKSLLQSCAGSLLNHHQCAASTWMMRRLPQDNGASALTTHQLQVERRERVIEPIKWMGRPWLTRASGGNLAKTLRLHPYSLREVPWDF